MNRLHRQSTNFNSKSTVWMKKREIKKKFFTRSRIILIFNIFLRIFKYLDNLGKKEILLWIQGTMDEKMFESFSKPWLARFSNRFLFIFLHKPHSFAHISPNSRICLFKHIPILLFVFKAVAWILIRLCLICVPTYDNVS